MPLAALHHVSVHHGGPLLLEDTSVQVEPGRKIGLIGRNGSGKTTLLRMLAGDLAPTAGAVAVRPGLRVGYQAQELVFAPGETVIDAMRTVFAETHRRERRLRALEERIAAAPEEERVPLLAEYARVQGLVEHEGLFDVDQRIRSTLTSLGLPEPTWHQPVARFSGGERNVIGLARVLLSDPELMLLDEPSNHLDMDGVEWFIRFLRKSPAAVVMVSHNRHLLDATVDEIWDLSGRTVTAWAGNYGDFQRQKAEADALRERQWKVQQRLIERIQFQARRLMDMANAYDDPGQARRAKSMLKRLERMDLVERPAGEGKRFRASLGGSPRHGRIALVIDGFSFAHGDRVLFEDAHLEIEYGERVALVGPNGSGKTTLFRQILDHGGWENPVVRLGKSVRVGEYRQLHETAFAEDATLEQWLMDETGLDRGPAQALLHRFLFRREDLDRPVRTLSGGEKSRLQLARLVQQDVNFLLLDEPTNHLDIESAEVLEEMLLEFEGTLLVISHDRYFLDRLVQRVVEVRDRRLVDHKATFAEWWAAKQATDRARRGALEDRRDVADKSDAREAFEARRTRQREVNRLRSRVREIEVRIAILEARREDLRRDLEAAWADAAEREAGERMSRAYEDVGQELDALYGEWSDVAHALERAEAPETPAPPGVPPL
jgi:ATPase subunit of ABC transporter with duplicated ATPase domains